MGKMIISLIVLLGMILTVLGLKKTLDSFDFNFELDGDDLK